MVAQENPTIQTKLQQVQAALQEGTAFAAVNIDQLEASVVEELNRLLTQAIEKAGLHFKVTRSSSSAPTGNKLVLGRDYSKLLT